MRSHILLAALAGWAIAAPAPQDIDYEGVEASPDPVFVAAPLDVQSDTPPEVAPEPVTPVTTEEKRDLLAELDDLKIVKRADCVRQPPGSGPVPSPDTPEAFSAYPPFAATASNAPTPDGYSKAFTNLNGSLSAAKYMGLYTLNAFDTLTCASKCDQASGCQAFNMYIERDPSVDPNSKNCSNPPSTTNYKCTLWGASVVAGQATNYGQYRGDFHVVIAGSNGYNKVASPCGVSGYTGPVALGGAINAPLDAQGHDTYMGYKYFPFSQSQGYSPQTCADACTVQTAYNKRHPAADGSYRTCVFFNIYVLSQNSIPQGLYCSLYNETWAPSYATNYGQYRGSDRYTVSRSYSYSLITTNSTNSPSTTDPSNPFCTPSAISNPGTTSTTSTISNPGTTSTTSTTSTISNPGTTSTTSTTSASSTPSSTACQKSGPYITNGNFEDGKTDPTGWSLYNFRGSLTFGPVSPGSVRSNSAKAWAAHINPGGYSHDISGVTMETTMDLCPGMNYSVRVDYRFDNAANNLCTFTIKYPYKDSSHFGSIITGSAVPGYQTNTWFESVGTFQAVNGRNLFIMDFACPGGLVENISVDDVRIAPFNGNAF